MRNTNQKGRRLVVWLVQFLRENLDDKAYEISSSGRGIDKNDLRLPAFNIEVECKNANQVSLISDWEQTKRQVTGQNVGVLAIRNPKKPEFVEVLMVMGLNDWINLVASQKGEVNVVGKVDPRLKYDIMNTREALRNLLKKLESNE